MAQSVEVNIRGTHTHSAEVTPPGTAAIILAAGASTRMGTPKSELPIGNGTFLTHLTRRLAEQCHPVIVVIGAHTSTPPPGARTVLNSAWKQGQLSSLQCGLRALPPATPSALFTLVDHPDPSSSTITLLLSSPKLIAIPVHQGHRGHPVFFRAPLFGELLSLQPTDSAKPVFRRYTAETDYIAVEDPAVLDDIDDAAALARFRQRKEGA